MEMDEWTNLRQGSVGCRRWKGVGQRTDPHLGCPVRLPLLNFTLVSASTLSEVNASEKTGEPASLGAHASDGRLAQARVDGSKQVLTTNQGVAIADNQNSLKAGLRGPTLL